MTDKVLLDTNLWVYFYSKDPLEKHQRVEAILRTHPQSIKSALKSWVSYSTSLHGRNLHLKQMPLL
jgi:predicted nucleic acid-binding protein